MHPRTAIVATIMLTSCLCRAAEEPITPFLGGTTYTIRASESVWIEVFFYWSGHFASYLKERTRKEAMDSSLDSWSSKKVYEIGVFGPGAKVYIKRLWRINISEGVIPEQFLTVLAAHAEGDGFVLCIQRREGIFVRYLEPPKLVETPVEIKVDDDVSLSMAKPDGPRGAVFDGTLAKGDLRVEVVGDPATPVEKRHIQLVDGKLQVTKE